MKKPGKNEIQQACSFVLCIAVAWIHADDFGASGFSGGQITGPVFFMFDKGTYVLGVAVLLTFIYPRIASAFALAGVCLCLPLYLYVTLPGPFRFFFPGNYSVPLSTSVVWDTWAIAGMLTLVLAVFLSIRSFSAIHLREKPYRKVCSH
ncbi:MAG: hypothetical protein WCE73_19665 [Candidatus Angelobacter sp.]|jgi:hypothetical protein